MADKNVHGGHRKRLRDRAMSEGLEAFNPHQVLELLLFYAIPRQDTSEIAHLLIDRFGSVHDVLNASAAELMQVPGVGKKTADWLVDLGMLVHTYGELRAEDRPKIVNFQSALWFCEDVRDKCEPQTVYALCTTPSGTIQIFVKICDSLAWGDSEVLRRCLEEALSVKARSVIVVEFIDADRPCVEEYHRQSAEKYACTMSFVGAELLDVILVGRTEVLSMNKTGDYDRKKHGEAKSILAENYLREDIEIAERGEEQPLVDLGL